MPEEDKINTIEPQSGNEDKKAPNIDIDNIMNSKMKLEPRNSSFGLDLDISPLKNIIFNFFFPLIAIIASIIAGIFITYPNYKKMPELKDTLAQKKQLRDTLDAKISKLNRFSDFQSVLDENLKLVNQVLYTEPEVPQILDQVHQIAKNSGMEISKLSYSYSGGAGTTQESDYNAVAVSLGGESSYDQLILFLKDIENAARFVEVSEFRYSGGQNEDDNLYSSSFSLSSPYLFVQSTAVTDEPIALDISSDSFIDFINKVKSLRYYDFLNPEIALVEETEESEEAEDTEAPPEGEAQPAETEPVEAEPTGE